MFSSKQRTHYILDQQMQSQPNGRYQRTETRQCSLPHRQLRWRGAKVFNE
ncbi:hypothetical protein PPRY_b0609 [Pseudoalteromonas prydzensis ACAM 620]|nr:hypothetical protein [Pseudoalteromonas prydzensis ACAM 620]